MTSQLIINLRQADSLNSELRVLSSVKLGISDGNERESSLLSEFQCELTPVDELRFHLGLLHLSEDDLKFLLCHIFDRRFGWSEHHAEGLKGLASKKSSLNSDLKVKSQINSILDDIIHLLMEERLSVTLLSGFHYAVSQAHSKPVVRNRTIIHVMDWVLVNRSEEEEFSTDVFLIIKEIIVMALVDVWSLIRNSCAVRLSHLIQFFGMDQLKDFFTTLVSICQDSGRNWQAREGAVMGIGCVIRRFQWIGLVPDERTSEEILSPMAECVLKFGKEKMDVMPEFISQQMSQLIYKLLADVQLTVREHAVKAYSLYISRSEFKDVLSSFQATIAQLCQASSDEMKPSDERLTDGTGTSPMELQLPHHLSVLNPNFQFLDAYLAEGLLGLCVHLVKHFPSGYLFSNWDSYISAFNRHIMHPASTVRQATSVIFKFIVAKNSSSPAMLKLVLLNLASGWFPSLVELTKDLSSGYPKQNLLSSSWKSITDLKGLAAEDETSICMTWQWREGRLLAYELIFQFLIKNHWLYTFGSADQTEAENGAPSGNTSAKLSHSFHDSFSGKTSLRLRTRTRGITTEEFVGARRRQRTQSFNVRDLMSDARLNVAQVALPDNLHLINSISESEQGQNELINSRVDSEHGQTESGRSRLSHPRYSIALDSLPGFRQSGRVKMEDSDAMDHSKKPLKQAETSLPTQRRESVSSYDAASLRLLGRRYNLRHCRVTQTLSSAKNVSLLLQCFAADNQEQPSVNEMPAVQLSDLRSLVRMILFQCVESLADSQWELRRMGHQLLPCVVEVIRWYDMSLLTELCDAYFTGQTTLLNYGMSLAVKYSMCHVADLLVMLHCSSHLWQDSVNCRELVVNITEPVQLKLSHWCSVALQSVERSIIDRITVVAVEVLMLAVIHFDSIRQTEESDKDVAAVVGVIVSIFCQANARMELAEYLAGSHWLSQKQIVPFDGFLSCCSKSDNNLHSFASQVERAFLSDIQACLPLFCRKIHIREALVLLPVLAVYFTKYADDDVLSRAISESIAAISLSVTEWHLDDSAVEISIRKQGIQLCLCGLANLVTNKATDQAMLQNVLHLYRNLLFAFSLTDTNLDILLRTVVTRLSKAGDTKPDVSSASPSCRGGKACLTYTDLTLLSNDIPSQPLEMIALNSEDDDEEEDDALDHSDPRVMWETQVLSAGPGIGLGLSPRGVPSVTSAATLAVSNGLHCRQTSKDSEDSDWDNWSSEDEEDASGVEQVLQQFLRDVDADLRSKGLGAMLEGGIQRLPEADRRHLVTSLVHLIQSV